MIDLPVRYAIVLAFVGPGKFLSDEFGSSTRLVAHSVFRLGTLDIGKLFVLLYGT
jgi:hypothetical protein